MKENRKEVIKSSVAMLVLIIIIGVVMSIVVRYQVNGEDNMPFEVSKIVVVSTAEGEQKEESDEDSKWNMIIDQNNDIYFNITKNENADKVSVIKYFKIENIMIKQSPKKGSIKAFMTNSKEGRKFVNKDDFLIEESLTYNGDVETNEKSLAIGNQGGTVSMRISNCGIGEYVSDEDGEIIHDGTLLKTIKTPQEQVDFKVSFDIVLNVDGMNYRANIELDLPYENIEEKGITSLEIDSDQIIFKRE